jgi:DNA-binding XRE family transcriptional regulator/mannose-6-phosphate isomerase-like protein (cupin superfamily)
MDTHSTKPAADSALPREAIRQLRKRNGMTLSDMSERTGLTISTISKLERGRISLSYDKLMLLSKALGVDIAQLLQPAPQATAGAAAPGGRQDGMNGGGRRVVQRAGEGQKVETSGYKHVYLATEFLNKGFTPLVGETKARTMEEFVAEFGDFIRHPGEEFALVLEGEIVFHTEFYGPVRLKTGDSVYFDSGMGHAYLKGSEEPCRIVAMCLPRGSDAEMLEPIISASERLASERAQAAPVPPRVTRAKARDGK